MKQIALTIEQMKHLEELGLDTSNASMCWAKEFNFEGKHIDTYLNFNGLHDGECVTFAYTLQDMLEKIPVYTIHKAKINNANFYSIYLLDNTDIIYVTKGYSMLEAVYQMLVWCIENGYIITK